MSFRDGMLQEEGFETDDEGFTLTIGLPRYRSLPLSCVNVQRLSLDGEECDLSTAVLHLDGRDHELRRLPDLYQEWWFVADRARLRVRRPSGIPPGEHDVELVMGLRVPYIFMEGKSECPIDVTRCRKRLRCVAGRGTAGSAGR